MNKNLEIKFSSSRIKKMVAVNNFFSGFFGRLISTLGWIFGAGVLLIWFYWLFSGAVVGYFGLDQILLALFLIFLAIRAFLRHFVDQPEILSPKKAISLLKNNQTVNLAACLSVDLAKVLLPFEKNIEEANLIEILAAAVQSSASDFIFARLGRAKSEILAKIEKKSGPSAVRFQTLMEKVLEIADQEDHQQIEVGDLLVGLSESEPIFSAYLSALNIDSNDLANIVYWQTEEEKKIDQAKIHLDPEHLHLNGGIGRDWAFGYTVDLDRFSVNITDEIEHRGLGLELIGHDKEIAALEQALNRSIGANAVLVGEPGVGKETTILGFARKIGEGRSLPNLAQKKIVQLDTDLLISGLSGPGEMTGRFSAILSQAANAGNIILYIKDIEKILSSGEAGQIDAAPVLAPYLSYPELSIVGTTDIANYNNLIAGNSALSSRLEKIEILEPTDEEMIRILEDTAPRVESHFRFLVTYGAIKEIIRVAKKYILDLPNPEKSINILEGAANLLAAGKKKIIDAETVDDYVESKTEIPVAEAEGKEKTVLMNLETELSKRIVGQKEAITAVAGALQRARTGVSESNKPIGSFLFLGPTGVGKTETAKALAAAYFGSNEAMIRFDMSEYQNSEDIYRLIGSPPGYPHHLEGELVSKIRNRPFSLILFDEIEKANPDILDLFLQILDEGFVTSSAGKKAYFKNSIIISTSNAGANLIRKLTAEKVDYREAKKQLIDFIQNQGIFKPEFLNRFSDIVYYSPLSPEEILEVAKIIIRKLAVRILQTKGIRLKVEIAALHKLAGMGYDPDMGARPMERVVEEQIENFIAGEILRGQAARDSELIFRASDIK